MLVAQLWWRVASRTLSQKTKFFAHEWTSCAVFSSTTLRRQGLAAERKLFLGCKRLDDVLHGSALSKPPLNMGFFADEECGFGNVIPVFARLGSAGSRRCFCTSEARIVDRNAVCSDLPNNDMLNWEELTKPHVKNYVISRKEIPWLREDFASLRKVVHASKVGGDDLFSHHDDAVGDSVDDQNDMGRLVGRSRRGTQNDRQWKDIGFSGGFDSQDPSSFQHENWIGECVSSDKKFDDSDDDEVDEENLASGLTVHGRDFHVFTPADTQTVIAICELFKSEGWSALTKETLNREYASSLSPAVISATILRQRNVALASSFFEWACEHKGHHYRIYHAYLIRLGETMQFNKMWALLTKMKENNVEVSVLTFCAIIRACGVAGVPAMAVGAFKRANDYGVVPDNQLHQALLTMFFESNLLEEAKVYYSVMVQQGLAFNTHLFNALIRGFNRYSATEDASSSFKAMLKEGQVPNILSYKGLIKAYCSVRAIEKAMAAFSDLQRRGLKVTAPTANILLGAFCRMGRINDAVDFFCSMKTVCTPNRSTFNILLHGLLVCQETSKAISLFTLMEQEGITNQLTYVLLASGLRMSKQTKSVRPLLKDLFVKHGYGMRGVSIAFLDSLCRLGEVDEAESLFSGMLESSQELNGTSFAMMIHLYSRLGRLDRAFELLSDLKRKGLTANVLCYQPLITALLKGGRVADALKCFQEMMDQKYVLSSFTYDCLLRELCKRGMADDALHVFNHMAGYNVPISKHTLKELLKCLCKAGKVEETGVCFKTLHDSHRLPLAKAAALQALSVMEVMGCPSNEQNGFSTCAAAS